jgi:hypothetical protein
MPPAKSAVMTGSGRYFDPVNPKASDVHLPDVARGLRRGVTRFNGQLLDPAECPHPQSGASHSMRVGRLVFWWLQARGLDKELGQALTVVGLVLGGLIHDSPEGYVGDDLGPIKTPERKDMEAKILAVIAEQIVGATHGLVISGYVENHPAVHWADQVALRQEALLYQPGAQDWCLSHERLSAGALADRLDWDVTEINAVQRRLDITDTLHLFHPREGEDWEATVMSVVEIHQALDRHGASRDSLWEHDVAWHMRRLAMLLG